MPLAARYSVPGAMEEDAAEVRTALAAYHDETGQADDLDFISTQTLYRLYRDWRATQRHDPNRPPLLVPVIFGLILRRAFPHAKRRQRQYGGRQCWGYCHVVGPKCIRSPLPLFPRRGAHARERRIEKLTAAQADHYLDPFEAAFRYVDGATYAAERAKFLGRSDDLTKLTESIGRIVQEEVDARRLSKDRQHELVDLLTVRFTADMLQMHKAVRTLKQLTHVATLGQFRSAINQMTDVAITATTQGIGSTIKGVRAAAGLGPADMRLAMEDIGIHSHGEEFKDVGKIAKAADRILTMTGFTRIDRFGKETLINAARDAMRNAAKNPESAAFNRLERDYRPVLGERFDSTMEALRADEQGHRNDDVSYLVFLEVSQIQPVTASQMPAAYLNNPNGRILYTLKTFTIMQLDLVRRQMLRKLATPGQRREGAQMLGAYLVLFGLVGFGKELLQDLLRGKEINADQIPDRSVEALLSAFALNRHVAQPMLDLIPDAVKKAVGLSTDDRTLTPTQAAMNLIAPPTSWIDALWSDVTNVGDGEGSRSIRHAPVIGDLLYYWAPFGRGSQLNEADAKADFREKLREVWRRAYFARQEGDMQSAASLLQVYNDRRTQGPGDGRKKPLTFADLSVLPATSEENKARRKLKEDAVEALRAGQKGNARDFLRRYNEGRREPLPFSDLVLASQGG